MSGYKWNQVVIIVSFGMITNLLGRIVANSLMLPVWLDSFGTFLTAYVLGSWCGALVGIAGSILYEFINPGAYIYSIVYVITALIVSYYSKHGWLSSYLKTVTLSFFVSAVSTVTACIINFVL